jgi:hypothetical protein
MKRLYQCISIGVLLALAASCGAPKYRTLQEPIQEPAEGKVIVNFLRPSGYKGGAKATVWDGDKLIGVSFGRMYFQYECNPGKHLFVSWSEYKSPVEAELLPNRVYYIALRIRVGWWRGRLHQVPLSPHHELWSSALTWEKTLPNYTFDQTYLAKEEAKGHAKITEYIQYYRTEVEGTKHVQYLRPYDGISRE